jgi:tetratricopeptide (TPR) repeat protein
MMVPTIAILLASLLAATAGGATPQPRREAEYVGSAHCFECHAVPFARWSGSHHAKAMQVATEETVLGDFGDASFSHRGVASRFFRRDGAFVVRTDGPDGTLADFEVKYTFGIEPLQQYLIELPGGRRQALGIAWNTAEQRWFHLYPDEDVPPGDVLHWTGPGQNWNSMCAECHSTNLRRNYRSAEDRYETSWSEIHVGCEACHGPASRHLAWAKSGGGGAETSKGLLVDLADPPKATWSMDPTRGIAVRKPVRRSHHEVETCAACHSRRTPLADSFSFGRPLLDTHRPALLEEGLYHADGQVDGEVYEYASFLQSKMYAAGVSCSDCHDAHSGGLHAAGNALCARCHMAAKYDTAAHHFHEPGTPGAQCVACHMPAKTFMMVDPRRDHGMRVPRPDLTLKIGSPNPCTDCHSERDAEWAAGSLRERHGGAPDAAPHYGEALHAGRHALADAESALVRVADDAEQPAIVRASALSLLGPYLSPASTATVERALRASDPLLRLGGLEAVAAVDPQLRLRLAFPLLDDPVLALRVAAVPVVTSVPAEMMTATQRAALEPALRAYAAAQMVSADRPGAHVGLGIVHAQLGDLQAAERDYATALRVGPYFIPAYVNLADLRRMQGRDGEGEALLRKALAVDPDSAAVQHSLGLLLVRRQRIGEALGALRRAQEIDPEDPRYAYVYGVALHSTGEPKQALRVLERAHQRHPGDTQILISLSMISREQGASDAALRYAKRLVALRPQDPMARQLLARLEAERGSSE